MSDDLFPVGFGSDLDDESRRILALSMALTTPDPHVEAFERRVEEKRAKWEAALAPLFAMAVGGSLAFRLPVHDEPWVICDVCGGLGWRDLCGQKEWRYSGEGGPCCGACGEEPCRWCDERGVLPFRAYDYEPGDEVLPVGQFR